MNAETSGRQSGHRAACRSSGLLGALRRDTSGNTLAMMAAFLLPLTALAGSAVDMSRSYLVKVRLQQACDAGVLAGRKLMTVTSGTALDPTSDSTKPAETAATTFFTNNFRPGWMQTSGVTFSPTRTADGQVTATATATMPMAVMDMFGFEEMTQTVTCMARLDIGDSDIMFVLDTTGSMACRSNETSGCSQPIVSYTRADGTTGYYVSEKSNSKLDGLRDAVLMFYDTLDTNADPSAHIRYGFVPYTSTVNVGYLLPQDSIVNSWTYQSRQWATGGSVTGGIPSDVSNGSTWDTSTSNITSAACTALAVRAPSTGYNTDGRATVRTRQSWTANSSGSSNGTCVIRNRPVRVNWSYRPVTFDVSVFKTGAAVPDPSKVTGATSRWQGCIEERDTTASASFNVNSLPADLDPDLPATSDATRWRPLWHDVIYYRGSTAAANDSGSSTNPYGDTTNTGTTANYTNMLIYNNIARGYVSCGKSAQRLAEMTRTQVSNYVNDPDFRPQGGTYHDVGMIWGTRLISPTGPFAADTAAWPGNNPPNRYIVFMTDGAMAPNSSIYGLYGVEEFDQRVTGGTLSNLTSRHNARFLASCAAAKARNITVFTVGFGTSLTTELEQCASPGFAYEATDNAALEAAFRSIALQVAKLRLSQ
jgi:Flp pilus assembly protein TadG